MKASLPSLIGTLCAATLSGCMFAPQPYDYTNYRASFPRSILVLPPLNQSTDVRGTYSYLSTVTYPLAEWGYYIFPVAVVDQFFKENGMPTAGEMHQAPLNKIREIIGADAVLYITLKQYSTKYEVIASYTKVCAEARLVDTRTGALLWEGTLLRDDVSGLTGEIFSSLIATAIEQAINSSIDHAHEIAAQANIGFTIKDHGLLYGPYHPKYGTD
jgi:hypothetical protein